MVVETYLAPDTLEDLTQSLSTGDATVLAGGTDLMPQTQAGSRSFRPTLVSLRRVPELGGICETDGEIQIGARTTITDILESGLLRKKAAVLVEAADQFASAQVRNMATLGGNICNASPAGDMMIPLLLLDAEVELASWLDGGVARRTMALGDFLVAPGRTRIQTTEVLTCVHFLVPRPQTIAVFRKLGTRPALDIAIVSVGIAGVRDGRCLRQVRVAFGAAAPTPVRGRKTEAALEGRPLDTQGIATVADAIGDDVAPISDVRASAWYRARVLRRMTERILHDVSQTDHQL
ncbi:MAG: FAD binding domain-containing protein [Phycisphaerae bacterium]